MEIRDRIFERLKQFDYDFSKYNLDDFLAFLEKDSGKKFQIIELDDWMKRLNVWACWLHQKNSNNEYFILDKAIPACLKRHVLAHEVGHFIMGHETARIDSIDNINSVLPETALARALSECGKTNDENEEEAEMVAVVLDSFEDEQLRFSLSDNSFIDRLWAGHK